MVARESLTARSLLLFCVAAGAAAQDEAPWSLVRLVDVAGNRTFGTAAIRDELAANPRVADGLLRARDTEEREQVIADCVADGYRRSGFVDVTVRAERKDGRLLLHVDEGPRCRIGAVRVDGGKLVPADDVLAVMRRAEGSWTGWQGDGWADCSSVAAARAHQRIAMAYAEAARYGVSGNASFVRNGDHCDLAITIRGEGRLVRIGWITLDGERPEDADSVLRRIQPPENSPLTLSLARSLRTQLQDLGRYLTVSSLIDTRDLIDTREASDTAKSPSVSVKVASFAPAMTDMPWDDLAQLRAGIATVRAHLDAGRLVRIVAMQSTELSRFGFTVPPGPWSITFGKDGVGVRCERVRCPDGSTNAVEILCGATRVLVGLGDGACGVADYRAMNSAEMWLTTRDDGFLELSWGFGVSVSGSGAPMFATSVHPASVLRLLQRGDVTRDGDDLVVVAPGGRVRVDRAGNVSSTANEGESTSALLPLGFEQHFDATLRRYDAARVQPLGAYLLRFGAANAAALTAATTPAQRDTLACLRSLADWWSTRPSAGEPSRDDEFDVPGVWRWPGETGATAVIAPILFAAARQTPEASWLNRLAASMRALVMRHGSGVKAVSALATAETSGPFATAAAAALLGEAGYDHLSPGCWQRAVEKCTADAA
ncbi:MAG TPA: hypothetical protein VFT55_12065, partial [Planctomycetota bacterium]|nr:hypothetical protein [Planctomycetota bacterium]